MYYDITWYACRKGRTSGPQWYIEIKIRQVVFEVPRHHLVYPQAFLLHVHLENSLSLKSSGIATILLGVITYFHSHFSPHPPPCCLSIRTVWFGLSLRLFVCLSSVQPLFFPNTGVLHERDRNCRALCRSPPSTLSVWPWQNFEFIDSHTIYCEPTCLRADAFMGKKSSLFLSLLFFFCLTFFIPPP